MSGHDPVPLVGSEHGVGGAPATVPPPVLPLAPTVGRRIATATATIAALSVVGRLLMSGRDVLLARSFGTSDALDAVLVAQALPLAAAVVLAGALPAAVLPVYASVRERGGRAEARELLDGTIVMTLVVVVSGTGFLALISPLALQALGSGFDAAQLRLTMSLFFTLLPLLLLVGVSTVLSGVLHSEERFVLAAIAPAITPVVIMAFLLSAGRSVQIRQVAQVTVVGAGVELLVLGLYLRRLDLLPIPRWHGINSDLRIVFRQYVPAAAGAFLMTGTLLVDQAIAASLGDGAVSALNYGGKAAAFIIGTGSVALGTAVLPHFSTLVAREDWDGMRATVKRCVLGVIALSVPATILLVVLSRPLVRIVFERGAFTSEDTDLVASIQALYLLQVPFYLLGAIGVRVLSAFRRNQVLLAVALGNVIVNVAADLFFVRLLGVRGIALATALVYMLSCSAVFATVAHVLRRHRITETYV